MEFFVEYLLQTFKNNYGYEWNKVEPVHIDHIIPLKYANNEKEVKKDMEQLNYEVDSIEFVDEETTYIKINNNLSKDEIDKTDSYLSEKYEASTDIGVVSNIVKVELIKNAIISLIIV